jgi:hypothetical protein
MEPADTITTLGSKRAISSLITSKALSVSLCPSLPRRAIEQREEQTWTNMGAALRNPYYRDQYMGYKDIGLISVN